MRQLSARTAQKWLDGTDNTEVPKGTKLFELVLTVRWLSPHDFGVASKLAHGFSDDFSKLLPNGARDRVEGYIVLTDKATKGLTDGDCLRDK